MNEPKSPPCRANLILGFGITGDPELFDAFSEAVVTGFGLLVEEVTKMPMFEGKIETIPMPEGDVTDPSGRKIVL